jgi:hypothetical protein
VTKSLVISEKRWYLLLRIRKQGVDMTKSFPWYFFAVMATTCRSGFAFVGFVPKAFVPASVKMNSSGLSESSDENSNKITNPSSAFGSPLSQNTADFNKSLVGFLKRMTFDNIYSSEGREFARFYALETIARVPYFSYLSALHLYETLGRWRKAKYLRLHFAESWNELHHLMIMEELGGSDLFFDRFFAQHVAVGYYLFTLVLYFVNPTLAYNFNQQIEEHAYLVYDRFLNDNEETLKSLPAPKTAIEYYRDGYVDL